MNLMLSAIVDSAHERREADKAYIMAAKNAEFEKHKKHLFRICERMDSDGSGHLSYKEILNGYKKDHEFSEMMQIMDVAKEDMTAICRVLDKDGSGAIDFSEFVEQLHKLKMQDSHALLVNMKCELLAQNDLVQKQLSSLLSELGKLRSMEPPTGMFTECLDQELKLLQPMTESLQEIRRYVISTRDLVKIVEVPLSLPVAPKLDHGVAREVTVVPSFS